MRGCFAGPASGVSKQTHHSEDANGVSFGSFTVVPCRTSSSIIRNQATSDRDLVMAAIPSCHSKSMGTCPSEPQQTCPSGPPSESPSHPSEPAGSHLSEPPRQPPHRQPTYVPSSSPSQNLHSSKCNLAATAAGESTALATSPSNPPLPQQVNCTAVMKNMKMKKKDRPTTKPTTHIHCLLPSELPVISEVSRYVFICLIIVKRTHRHIPPAAQ